MIQIYLLSAVDVSDDDRDHYKDYDILSNDDYQSMIWLQCPKKKGKAMITILLNHLNHKMMPFNQ